MTRLLSALVALVALPAGCAGPSVVCGPFRGAAATSCFRAFDYRSVVQIDSGRERDGVYRTWNSGSGILLDASGLLVTASHVVNGRDRVAVRVGDAVYTATRVPGLDFPEPDVAYLRITGAARAVPEGCVLSDTLPPCRFPMSTLAVQAHSPPAFGAEVQLLGYPSWKARLLRGRLVDPTPRFLRLAAEHGFGNP